jgi:hypothetical protein
LLRTQLALPTCGTPADKMLKEGGFHAEYTNEIVGRIDNLKELCVWDASGKAWLVPRRELKKLKEEAQNIQPAAALRE